MSRVLYYKQSDLRCHFYLPTTGENTHPVTLPIRVGRQSYTEGERDTLLSSVGQDVSVRRRRRQDVSPYGIHLTFFNVYFTRRGRGGRGRKRGSVSLSLSLSFALSPLQLEDKEDPLLRPPQPILSSPPDFHGAHPIALAPLALSRGGEGVPSLSLPREAA